MANINDRNVYVHDLHTTDYTAARSPKMTGLFCDGIDLTKNYTLPLAGLVPGWSPLWEEIRRGWILGAERRETSIPRLFRCKRKRCNNGDAFPKVARWFNKFSCISITVTMHVHKHKMLALA